MKKSIRSRSKTILFGTLILGICSSTQVQAQQSAGWEEKFPFIQDGSLIYLLASGAVLLVAVLLLLTCIYLYYNLSSLLGLSNPEVAKASMRATKESLWVRVNKRFISGELVPVENEKEIMMDHSYDGIVELDNHMPPWLKTTFYVTIFFAFVYVMHYLVLGTGTLQIEEYNKELAEAEAVSKTRQQLEANDIDETNATFISDVQILENAKTIYNQNCAACHGKDGGGTVGPNLADEYWLHGGDIKDIFRIIKFGVQEKGMIPWDGKLKPEEIQSVASYILTLQGTTPEKPKAPEGEKHTSKLENEVLSLK